MDTDSSDIGAKIVLLDWRNLILQYLINTILPDDKWEAHIFKALSDHHITMDKKLYMWLVNKVLVMVKTHERAKRTISADDLLL